MQASATCGVVRSIGALQLHGIHISFPQGEAESFKATTIPKQVHQKACKFGPVAANNGPRAQTGRSISSASTATLCTEGDFVWGSSSIVENFNETRGSDDVRGPHSRFASGPQLWPAYRFRLPSERIRRWPHRCARQS